MEADERESPVPRRQMSCASAHSSLPKTPSNRPQSNYSSPPKTPVVSNPVLLTAMRNQHHARSLLPFGNRMHLGSVHLLLQYTMSLMLLVQHCLQTAKTLKKNKSLRTILSGKGAGTPVRSACLLCPTHNQPCNRPRTDVCACWTSAVPCKHVTTPKSLRIRNAFHTTSKPLYQETMHVLQSATPGRSPSTRSAGKSVKPTKVDKSKDSDDRLLPSAPPLCCAATSWCASAAKRQVPSPRCRLWSCNSWMPCSHQCLLRA